MWMGRGMSVYCLPVEGGRMSIVTRNTFESITRPKVQFPHRPISYVRFPLLYTIY